MRSRTLRMIAFFSLAAILFVWVLVASDYSESVVIGTYTFTSPQTASTLTLRPDHTFHQTLLAAGQPQAADGTWTHTEEGGVSFSRNLLPVPGAVLPPDGTPYARIGKLFGLFVTLDMNQYSALWFTKNDTTTVNGTYTSNVEDGVISLTLKPDQTFHETFTRLGTAVSARGTWRRTNGRITFSSSFLNAQGKALDADETAFDRDPRDGHMQVEIAKSGHPSFRKHYFF